MTGDDCVAAGHKTFFDTRGVATETDKVTRL